MSTNSNNQELKKRSVLATTATFIIGIVVSYYVILNWDAQGAQISPITCSTALLFYALIPSAIVWSRYYDKLKNNEKQ